MKHLINIRKAQHIEMINSDDKVDRSKNYFDFIHLKHRALPELDLAEIDPSVVFMNKKLSFPLLISSMTGGDYEIVNKINKNCAIAAQETGIAMGVGSQRVMFTTPEARKSFAVRQFAPDALLFSNLGAVQLNYGFDISHCREAVETVGADALYFHLNPLQEAVQPEGDTNFSGLADKIGDIAGQLKVPVILKEVGAGISDTDVELLLKKNIHYIDVAGSGGTSWSRIESLRNKDGNDLGIKFQDWGIPTPVALGMLEKYKDKITLVASGGIRTGLDMVKSVILGASLCGLAKPLLKPAMESPQAVIDVIKKLKREFTVAMFLLGMKDFKSLHFNKSLMLNRVENDR
ncbi:type 2 isopentenyl-diphosphate Delta-isomerase [candidate division KSB1 bacterium]|nr:type 2 isopentenyl-diphosphate Delta-isomerase [candidate division KSB1 bacterium]